MLVVGFNVIIVSSLFKPAFLVNRQMCTAIDGAG